MTGPVTTNTDLQRWSSCSSEPGGPSKLLQPSDRVKRDAGGSAIQGLRDLGNQRSLLKGGVPSSCSALEIGGLGAHGSRGELPLQVVAENPASNVEEARGTLTEPGISHDVEALSIAPAYVDCLDVSTISKVGAIAAEFVAKFFASGLHFGLARQYTESALKDLLTHMASSQPLAKSILDNPRTYAAISVPAAALALAVSHYLAEVYFRPIVLTALGRQVVPTKEVDAFPNDELAQGRMKRQQAAGKIGKLPADLIGLVSFSIANGIRGVLGGTSPLAASLTSGVGGGTMAALHSLLNLSTHTKADDDCNPVPTHHIGAARYGSMQDFYDVISQSFRSVAGNGPINDQLANTLQDIFGVRGVAALQGLLISNLLKAAIEADFSGRSPAAAQKFGHATAATLALLGLGFFANLSLAARRGKTSGVMSGSIAALKSMDPRKSGQDGGMHALMETTKVGAGARAWNTALRAIDTAAHTGKTLQTLPGHAVLDGLTLAVRGAKWMTTIVRKASGLPRA